MVKDLLRLFCIILFLVPLVVVFNENLSHLLYNKPKKQTLAMKNVLNKKAMTATH